MDALNCSEEFTEYFQRKCMKWGEQESDVSKKLACINLERILNEANSSRQYQTRGTVLLISDRLLPLCLGLQYFFLSNTDFEVLGVASDYLEAMELCKDKKVDLLILGGYQKKAANYDIIRYLKVRDGTQAVMWALRDGLIDEVCAELQIKYVFNRFEPLDQFIRYIMSEIYKVLYL